MALLSKFLEDFGHATGIPAIGLTRAVYSAAIIGYIANVVVPGLKRKPKIKVENEEEAKVQAVSRQNSQHPTKPKGPAVNKYKNIGTHSFTFLFYYYSIVIGNSSYVFEKC